MRKAALLVRHLLRGPSGQPPSSLTSLLQLACTTFTSPFSTSPGVADPASSSHGSRSGRGRKISGGEAGAVDAGPASKQRTNRTARASTVAVDLPASAASLAERSSGADWTGEAGGARQLSVLQRCLAAHGIQDVSFFEHPRFTKYANEKYVRDNVEQKLVALEAEGLGPEELGHLLREYGNSLIPCPLQVFMVNLEELQETMRGFEPQHGGRNKVTAKEGLSVVEQLACTARHQILAFLTCHASLTAKREWLGTHLQLSTRQVAGMIWQQPAILTCKPGPRLLELLPALDELKGEAGWGRRMLLKAPNLAFGSAARMRQYAEAVELAGCSRAEAATALWRQPAILASNLGGPVLRQKLAWIQKEAPWGLGVFLGRPRFLQASLPRMASRLAFIREHRLPMPNTPMTVAELPDKAFYRRMSRELGRELSVEGWRAWVEGVWRPSPQGQQWGSKPQGEHI